MATINSARWVRRFIWLVITVVALWSLAWFAASRWVDQRVVDTIQRLGERGVDVACADRKIAGFPFSLNLECDETAIVTVRGTERLDVKNVSAGADLTNPGRLTAQLGAPLVTYAGGQKLEIEWASLSGLVDATFDGGFDLSQLDAVNINALRGDVGFTAQAVNIRVSPLRANRETIPLHFDIAAGDLTLAIANKKPTPLTALTFLGHLENGYSDLIERRVSPRELLSNGAAVDVETLLIEVPDGGFLGMKGPVSIDRSGLISGEIKIGILNPDAVSKWAADISPQMQQVMAGVGQAVAGMGREDAIGPQQLRTITVKIDQGELRLGFIRLGTIPPLR